MLFHIFLHFAHAFPTMSISVEKQTPCSPVLYTLLRDCTIHRNNTQTITQSGFFWNDSLWTTHRLLGGMHQLLLEGNPQVLEINPRANYARISIDLDHEQWKKTATVEKKDSILCVGFDEQGRQSTQKGLVLDRSSSIVWNGSPTPPLLQTSCRISSSMLGGAVITPEQELVGMITAFDNDSTYVLPVHRLRSTTAELGLQVHEEQVTYSTHSDIPVGSEVLAIFREYKESSPPLIQLLEDERLRVRLLDDDVWISPHNPQYNRISIFEERDGAQYVLRPSAILAQMGLREHDRWNPNPKSSFATFSRGKESLWILNPSRWEQ